MVFVPGRARVFAPGLGCSEAGRRLAAPALAEAKLGDWPSFRGPECNSRVEGVQIGTSFFTKGAEGRLEFIQSQRGAWGGRRAAYG